MVDIIDHPGHPGSDEELMKNWWRTDEELVKSWWRADEELMKSVLELFVKRVNNILNVH